jgi:xylulose-5-phosphate/fructose-6-phosphate phosphoketolase
VPDLAGRAARVRQLMVDQRAEARAWTRIHGEDHPMVADWVWPG